MMWSSAYYFKVTVHQILVELYPLKISIIFLFLAKSSYRLHPIKLKLHKLLQDDVEQRILFRGYSAPNIGSYAPLKVFCKLFAAYCLEVIVCKFYFVIGIFFAFKKTYGHMGKLFIYLFFMPLPFSMGERREHIVSPLSVRTSFPSVHVTLLVSVRYLLKGLVYCIEILYTGI